VDLLIKCFLEIFPAFESATSVIKIPLNPPFQGGKWQFLAVLSVG